MVIVSPALRHSGTFWVIRGFSCFHGGCHADDDRVLLAYLDP